MTASARKLSHDSYLPAPSLSPQFSVFSFQLLKYSSQDGAEDRLAELTTDGRGGGVDGLLNSLLSSGFLFRL